jgi:hypothetical protein
MKRIRIIGLAIVAALAISALASASAFAALPEWFKGGKVIAAAVKVTGTGGAGTLETIGGKKVTCTSDSSEGEITPPKNAANVVVTYKGCESAGVKCNTAGKAAGEVVTNKVGGELVYVDAGKTKVGLLLKPATGTEFAKFECTAFVKVTVTGEVIGQAKPLNIEQNTGELVFKQTKGVQEFRQIEGAGATHHLTSFGEESAIEVTENLTFAEKVELKA